MTKSMLILFVRSFDEHQHDQAEQHEGRTGIGRCDRVQRFMLPRSSTAPSVFRQARALPLGSLR